MTLLSPSNAMLVNGAHLTAIMLRRSDSVDDLAGFVKERKPAAFVLGPGAGVTHHTRTYALELLAMKGGPVLVLDADGMHCLREAPEHAVGGKPIASAGLVRRRMRASSAVAISVPPPTPKTSNARHRAIEGQRARRAAERAHGVVVLKGDDTVVGGTRRAQP